MTKLVPAAAIACLASWWLSGDWLWLVAMVSVSAIVAWTMILMKENTIVPLMEAKETTRDDVVKMVADFCALAHPRFAFGLIACGISLRELLAPTPLGEPMLWLSVAFTGILAGQMAWAEVVGCITVSKLKTKQGLTLAAMMTTWWPAGALLTSVVAAIASLLNIAAVATGMATMHVTSIVCHVIATLLCVAMITSTHAVMSTTALSMSSPGSTPNKPNVAPKPHLGALAERFHAQHLQRLGMALGAFLLVLVSNIL